MKKTRATIQAFVLFCAVTAAWAQIYPAKPIRIVVGFPPGGGNDIIARLIAAEFVAKSAPDGYTLLVNATGGMSVNPVLYTKLPYDSLRDFAPISMVGSFPLVLVVHPSVPANSVRELVAYAKANPGKLNYSAGSTAFQVASEMFKQMTGTDIKHIPYNGSAASITAVMAGEVQKTILDTTPLVSQINRGGGNAVPGASSQR